MTTKRYPFIPDHIHVGAAPVDITGHRYGRLVAVRVVGKHRSGSLLWLCRCDCGVEAIRKSSVLRNRQTQSCGCQRARAKAEWHENNPAWNLGRTYQIKGDDEIYRSKAAWTAAAIRRFGNRCSRCGWSDAKCDVHHRLPRARAGLNTIANAIVLCPNCHRVQHPAKGSQ